MTTIIKPERKAAVRAMLDGGRDFQVFAYGSLMWNPSFPYLAREPARIYGFHRAFCVYSHRYRGTPERPGLVLGLARGGSCKGILYRVSPAEAPAVLDYLWDREMVTGVYEPQQVKARTDSGMNDAHTFVADPHHRQYAGALPFEETVKLVRQGVGGSGRCIDYLADLVVHLDALGIAEGPLHRLLKHALD